MAKRKTDDVKVSLPTETLAVFERFARLSGVPVSSVIRVCLAIQVSQAQDLTQAATRAPLSPNDKVSGGGTASA